MGLSYRGTVPLRGPLESTPPIAEAAAGKDGCQQPRAVTPAIAPPAAPSPPSTATALRLPQCQPAGPWWDQTPDLAFSASRFRAGHWAGTTTFPPPAPAAAGSRFGRKLSREAAALPSASVPSSP